MLPKISFMVYLTTLNKFPIHYPAEILNECTILDLPFRKV